MDSGSAKRQRLLPHGTSERCASPALPMVLPQASPPPTRGGLGADALGMLPAALADLAANFPAARASALSTSRLEELENALRSLTEMASAASSAKRSAAAAAHNAGAGCALLQAVLRHGDIREVLFSHIAYPTLRLVVMQTCRTMRGWVAVGALGRGVTVSDVAASIHVPLLRHLCTLPGEVITLAPGRYSLGDAQNPDHVVATYADWEDTLQPSWDPRWKKGFGPLMITGAGVTFTAGEGVRLGFHGTDQGLSTAVEEVARHVDCSDFFSIINVRATGIRLLNCNLQQPQFSGRKPSSMDGVSSMQVWDNSSVRAISCAFSFVWTGQNCDVAFEDCQIQGSSGCGLNVARDGVCSLVRCNISHNHGCGVWVSGSGTVSATDCQVCDNGVSDTNPESVQGHSNLGGGFAGETGSMIILKGGCVAGNIAWGVSTKGSVQVKRCAVSGNGHGDFCEEKSGSVDSTGSIKGVDANRLSNDLAGTRAPSTKDAR